MRKLLISLALAAIVPSQAMASTAAATPVRAASTTSNGNQLVGIPLIFAILAGVAVVAGIVVIADNNESPNSP